MQRLITLIILAGIIYMILEKNTSFMSVFGNFSNSQQEVQKTSEEANNQAHKEEFSGNFIEKTVANVMVNVLKTEEGKNFFGNLIVPIDQNSRKAKDESFKVSNLSDVVEQLFDIKTFGVGDKGPASCGHAVTVKYKISSISNIPIKEGSETFFLGSNKIVPGLDAVIVGMKTGQSRKAIIKKNLLGNLVSKDSNANNSDLLKVDVLLNEIMPNNFVDANLVRVFDDEISYAAPLVCGNQVVYHAKITRLSDGVVMYDSKMGSKPLVMTIGQANYPVIFSYALHGKIPTGTRTVISPGKYFKSYAVKNSFIFPNIELPENEYFMLDLSIKKQ